MGTPRIRTSCARTAACCGLLGGLALVPALSLEPVYAQVVAEDPLTSKFVINDEDPVSSVPTPAHAMKQPLEMGYHIMLLSERADAASQRGDHVKAAAYWRALAKATPDRSLPHTRMCQEYEAVGDFPNALEHCRAALGKGGVTLDDNLRFVRLVIDRKPGKLDTRDVDDIEAIAAHVEQQLAHSDGPLTAQRIRCKLGMRLDDLVRLDACTKKLRTLAPDDPETLVYTWSHALRTGNLAQAEQAVQQAKRAKLPESAIQRMADTLQVERSRRAPWWQRSRADVLLLAAAVSIVALVLLAAFVGSRRQRVA